MRVASSEAAKDRPKKHDEITKNQEELATSTLFSLVEHVVDHGLNMYVPFSHIDAPLC